MLILTRRINEGVIVADSDDNILAQVTVTNIDKNQVKLGIDTPVCNKAYRSELYEKIFKNE
jgi:carbon storage regulator CsrA